MAERVEINFRWEISDETGRPDYFITVFCPRKYSNWVWTTLLLAIKPRKFTETTARARYPITFIGVKAVMDGISGLTPEIPVQLNIGCAKEREEVQEKIDSMRAQGHKFACDIEADEIYENQKRERGYAHG